MLYLFIWAVGFVFSVGYCVSHMEKRHKYEKVSWIIVGCLLCWPLLLGACMGER